MTDNIPGDVRQIICPRPAAGEEIRRPYGRIAMRRVRMPDEIGMGPAEGIRRRGALIRAGGSYGGLTEIVPQSLPRPDCYRGLESQRRECLPRERQTPAWLIQVNHRLRLPAITVSDPCWSGISIRLAVLPGFLYFLVISYRIDISVQTGNPSSTILCHWSTCSRSRHVTAGSVPMGAGKSLDY